MKINGHPCKALLDSGTTGDFVSPAVAQQLGLKRKELTVPLPLQMACQGFRSKINFGVTAQFEYQTINCEQYFDIANLHGHDVILGTPFIFQHSILSGLNLTWVIIGSAEPLPMEDSNVMEITSEAIEIVENNLKRLYEELHDYARPLCCEDEDIPLPPFCAINHSISLIDLDKVYLWHPSHCPEALRPLWAAKRTAYLKNEW